MRGLLLLLLSLCAVSASWCAPVVSFQTGESQISENGGSLRVVIFASEAPTAAVTINYTVAGTATAASDYQALSGVATIPAGALATTVTLTLVNDATQEKEEQVRLTLSGVSGGASLGTNSTHVVTIKDDDIPLVNFSSSGAIVDENGAAVTATVSLSKSNTQPVTVYYRLLGTAVAGADYQPVSGQVDFAVGQQSRTITLTPINDDEEEQSEAAELELYGTVGANLGSTLKYTLTIKDDEQPGLHFVETSMKLKEAQQDIIVQAELSRAATETVSASYELFGTAENGKDYTHSVAALSFPAGTTRRDIKIRVLDDTDFEGDETIGVRFSGATGASIAKAAPAEVTIVDNEVPSVEFPFADASVVESSGGQFITVQLSHAATQAVEVSYTVEGSASVGSDYQTLPLKVRFEPGEVSKNINLVVVNDAVREEREELTFTLVDGGAHANIGLRSVYKVAILDDDQPAPLQLSPNGVAASTPDIALDAGGNAHVIWRVSNNLWYVRVNAAGEITLPARQVTSNTTILVPRVAADSQGRAHVVYATQSRSALGYLLLSTSGTLVLNKGVQIYPSSLFSTQSYDWPAIAIDRNDRAVIASEGYIRDEAVPPAGREFIAAVRIGPDGAAELATRWAGYTRSFGSGVAQSFAASRCDLAIDGGGQWHLTWKQRDTGWTGPQVAYRCPALAQALFLGDRNLLNTYGGPQISRGDSGLVELTWVNTNKMVLWQQLTSLGQKVGEYQVVSEPEARPRWPEVGGAAGKVYVAWMDDRSSQTQIRTRSPQDAFFTRDLTESPTGATFERMAVRGNQSVDYVWVDTRGGQQRIFYRQWLTGAAVQARQDYDRATDRLTLTARVYDPQMGEIKVGELRWTLKSSTGAATANGLLRYGSDAWNATQDFATPLQPGNYRVDYDISYTNAGQLMSGGGSGEVVVYPFFSIVGKITDKKSGNALENVQVTIGATRDAEAAYWTTATNNKGEYEFKNLVGSKAHFIRARLEHYTRWTQKIDIPAEGQQLVINMELQDGVDRPVVNGGKLKYAGIFFAGLASLNNSYTPNIEWNNGQPGYVEYAANDTSKGKATPDAEGNVSFPVPIATWFTGMLGANANYLTITAVDAQGRKSEPYKQPIYIIPLPDAFTSIFYAANLLLGGAVGSDPVLQGEYTFKEWTILKSIPVIGKLGPDIKCTFGGLYKLISGEWNVYVNGRPEGRWSKEGIPVDLVNNSKDKRMLLHLGEAEIEILPQLQLSGKATATEGITFNDPELSIKAAFKDKLMDFLATDYIPGGSLLRLLDFLKHFGIDVNSIQRASLWADIAIGASSVVQLRPAIRPQNLDASFEPGMRMVYNPKVCDDLQAELTAGGKGSLKFNLLPDCTGLKGGSLTVYGALLLKAKTYEKSFEYDLLNWEYAAEDQAPLPKRIAVDRTIEVETGWQPIARPNLLYGPPRFLPVAGAKSTEAKDALAAVADFAAMSKPVAAGDSLPLQTQIKLIANVFPESSTALAARGNELMLLYVDDNGSGGATQFTNINATYFNGSTWSTAAAILNDSRAEFAPAVSFDGTGDAVAVWERVKLTNFTGTELDLMSPQLEIVWSRWARSSGTWSAPAALTNNSILDHAPLIAGPLTDGDLIALWTENPVGLYVGQGADGTTSNSTVKWVRWDSATHAWGTPATLVSNLTGRLSQSLAAAGNGALYAYTRDANVAANGLADTEVYAMSYNGSTWGAAARLTNDALADGSVRAFLTAAGAKTLLWRSGESLVLNRDLASTVTLVRPGAAGIAFSDYAAAQSPLGHLALCWTEQSPEGSDLWWAMRDPASGRWGEPQQLTRDREHEYRMTPVFDSASNLVLAYDRCAISETTKTVTLEGGGTLQVPGVPTRGQTDLLVLKQQPYRDLEIAHGAVNAVYGSTLPGQSVQIDVQLANRGSLPVASPAVALYDGNPQSGGKELARRTAAEWIDAGTTLSLSFTWVISEPAAAHSLYVVADPANAVAEYNEYNNVQWLTLGGTDLGPAGLIDAQVAANGGARLTIKVGNAGGPTAPASQLALRIKGNAGAPLATVAVPALPAGSEIEVPIDLAAGSLPAGSTRTFVINTDEGKVTGDVNALNDVIEVSLAGKADTTPPVNVTTRIVLNETLVPVGEGSTGRFTVALSGMPLADVTLAVTRSAGDADVTVQSGATLTFTRSNWSTPQVVTLAAAEDADSVNATATIRVAQSGGSGIAAVTLTARELDNETQNSVSGTIATNTTWSDTSKDYVLTGKLTIASGATLTIGSNVTVRNSGWNQNIEVQGTLTAGAGSKFLMVTYGSYYTEGRNNAIHVVSGGRVNLTRALVRTTEMNSISTVQYPYWACGVFALDGATISIRGTAFVTPRSSNGSRTSYAVGIYPAASAVVARDTGTGTVCSFTGFPAGICWWMGGTAQAVEAGTFTACDYNQLVFGNLTTTFNFYNRNTAVHFDTNEFTAGATAENGSLVIKNGGRLNLNTGSELKQVGDQWITVERGGLLKLTSATLDSVATVRVHGTMQATSSTLISQQYKYYYEARRNGIEVMAGGTLALDNCSAYYREGSQSTDSDSYWSAMVITNPADTANSLPAGHVAIARSFFTNARHPNNYFTPYALLLQGDDAWDIRDNVFLRNHRAVQTDQVTNGAQLTLNDFEANTSYAVNNTAEAAVLGARGNWWGSASGPTHPGNPGGTGDLLDYNVDFGQTQIARLHTIQHVIDPASGQRTSALGTSSDQPGLHLLGFRFTPGNCPMDRVGFRLSEKTATMAWDKLGNWRVALDANGDGQINGSETTLVGGEPQLIAEGADQLVVFSTPWQSAGSSALNYILLGDARGIVAGDGFTVQLDDRHVRAPAGKAIRVLSSAARHVSGTAVQLAEHARGQFPDRLNGLATQSAVPLFGFRLVGAGKQVEKLDLTLAEMQGISTGKFDSLRLIQDANSNGAVDTGEITVGGTPTITINGATGTIRFSTLFATGSSYLLVADLQMLVGGDRLTISLPATGVDLVGTETATGSCLPATHLVDAALLVAKSVAWTPPTNFGAQPQQNDVPLMGLQLLPTGQQVERLVVRLSNTYGITAGEISNARLVWDEDGDGQAEAGEAEISRASAITLAGGRGTIEFTTPFMTRGDLILLADFTNLEDGDEITCALVAADVTPVAGLLASGSVGEVRLAVGGGGVETHSSKNMQWTLTWRSPGGTAVSGRFDHSGNRVILGYDTGSAWIYDTSDNRPIAMLKDHYDKVRYAGFSSDDSAAVTVSRDGAVYIWDLTSTASLKSAMFSDLLVTYAVPSPDFSRLMVITEGKGVLLNVDTQQKLWEFIPGSATVNAIAYSPDGKTIAVGCSDKRAYVLDAVTGVRQGNPFIGHSQTVTMVGYTSDSARLMTGSSDGMVQFWNIAAHSVLSSRALGANAQGAAVSADGSRVAIVVGSGDSAELQMYQPVTGQMLQLYARNLKTTSGSNWGGTLENITFDDATGRVLVNSSGGGWGTVACFRVGDGSYLRSWGPQGRFSDIWSWDSRPRISADGERVFYQTDWGMNLLFRTLGKTIRRAQVLNSWYGFAINNDGSRLSWVDNAYNGSVHVESVSDAGFSHQFSMPKGFYYYNSMAMSPDGLQCAVGNQLFSTLNGARLAMYGATANGNRGAFSPDGARWGFQDPPNKALITCRTNDPYATLDRMVLTDPDTPFMMLYHPDNQRVGHAYRWTWQKRYSGVQMFDMDSNDGVGLYKHDGELYDSAISDDGSLLLLGGDNNVRLYDMRTGSVLRYFYPQHSSLADVRVRTVQFARHDSLIMIAWNYNYIETYERSKAASIELKPGTRTLAPGQTQSFQVEVVYDDTTRRDITPQPGATDNDVKLEIEPAGRATVDGNLVTVAPGAFGQFTVRARYREGRSNLEATANVTIGSAALNSLTADPAQMTLNPGVFRGIRYTAHYADGFATDVTTEVKLTADRLDDLEILGQSVKVEPWAAPGNIRVTGRYTDPRGGTAEAITTVIASGPRTEWERYRVTGGGYGLSGAYSPDNLYLTLGSSSGALNVYKVGATPTQYKLEQVILGHTAPVRYVEYYDNTHVVTVGQDGMIRTWALDAPSTTPLSKFQHSAEIRASQLIVEGGNRYLAIGDVLGRVGLFNLVNNTFNWLVTVHTGEVTCIAVDANRVVSGGMDKRIKVLGRADGSVARTLNIHTQALVALGFMNGGMLYTIGADNVMNRLSSTYDPLERYDFPATPTAATVSRGYLYVATGNPPSTWVYNMDGLLLRWLDHPPAEGTITHYLMDPTSTYLLTGRMTGKKTVALKFMGEDIGEEEVVSPFASWQFWEGSRGIYRGSLAHSFPLSDAHPRADGQVIFTQDAKRTMAWTFVGGTQTTSSRLMETGYFITPHFEGMDFNASSSILGTRVGPSIFFYDTVKNLLWKTHHTAPGPFTISPNATRLATADSKTRLWDLANLSQIKEDPRVCAGMDFRGENWLLGGVYSDRHLGIWNASGLMANGTSTDHNPMQIYINQAGDRCVVISEEVRSSGFMGEEEIHDYYLETYDVKNSFEGNLEPTKVSSVFLLSVTKDLMFGGGEDVGFCFAISEDGTLALVGASGDRPVKLINMNDTSTIREFYPPTGKGETHIGATAVSFLPGDNAIMIGWAEGYAELWRRVAPSTLQMNVMAAEAPATSDQKRSLTMLGDSKAATPLMVKPGQVLQLEGITAYSNGTRLNVTPTTTFTSDKPTAIVITGSVATVATRAGAQTVTITASYTELGKMLTASVQLQIQSSSTQNITEISQTGYGWDYLELDKRIFTDQTWRWLAPIPEDLLHQPFIRTTWAHRNNTGASFLSFKISQPATIVVAVDGAMDPTPAWLSSWTPRAQTMQSNDPRPSRKLYQKYYAAGTVTLGANHETGMASDNTMYSVIVGPPDLGQTGRIEVRPTPVTASWALLGPDGKTLNSAGNQTYPTAACGSYRITWKALNGYTLLSAPDSTFVLGKGQTKTLSATYERQKGTVTIIPVPGEAGWTLKDGDGVTQSGTGPAELKGIPTGTISLLWSPLTGYDPPSATTVTQTLVNGRAVQFTGLYLPKNDTTARSETLILRYILGIDSDPSGLDRNGDGKIDAADVVYLIEHAMPQTATLLAPADAATSQTLTPTLDWSDCKYARNYDVYIWRWSEGVPATPTIANVAASMVVVPKLTWDTDYYWRVIAKNNHNSSTSSYRHFRTLPNPLQVLMNNWPTYWTLEEDVSVEWRSNLNVSGTNVRIELWRNNARVKVLGEAYSATGAGTFTVKLTGVPTGTDYKVRIYSPWLEGQGNPEPYDECDPTVVINPAP